MLKWTVGAYVFGLIVAPFAYSAALGKTCGEWGKRDVATFEVSDLEVLKTAVETPTIEVPFLPAGSSGMTIPGFTLVAADGEGDVVLHEAVHHLQIERDGLMRYSAKYVQDWVAGVYHGCGPHDAYRAISYEMQARRAVFLYPYHVVAYAEDGSGLEFVDKLRELEHDGDLVAMLDDGDAAWLERWLEDEFDHFEPGYFEPGYFEPDHFEPASGLSAAQDGTTYPRQTYPENYAAGPRAGDGLNRRR